MPGQKRFGRRNLQQYRVSVPGKEEYLRQSLYDITTYAAAGQSQLLFFQVPKGQGGKSINDTNMESAGSLPAPKKFLVESVEILFFPGVNPVTYAVVPAAVNFANDVFTVAKSGSLRFFISSKAYLEEAPLGRFPSKTRLEVSSSAAVANTNTASANQLATDYGSFAGRPYRLDPPVTLESNQNFQVELNWPLPVALPSGQPGRIGVVLDGTLVRPAQ